MGRPAPVRYAEQARPTPRPSGSLRNFSRQPEDFTTRRMHSERFTVLRRKKLAVTALEDSAMRRRRSAGAVLSFLADLLRGASLPETGRPGAWAPSGAPGGLFVDGGGPRKRWRG